MNDELTNFTYKGKSYTFNQIQFHNAMAILFALAFGCDEIPF